MAKSSEKQIQEDEKKIIEELRKNARGSIDNIAKKCGFSRQKVWRIIKRLEENKDVWGYNAIIDINKINMKKFLILIKRSTEPIDDAISKIIKLTMHKKGEELGVYVECSSYLHGRYDWMLGILARDMPSLKRFTHILEKEYQQVISEVHVMEDIFTVKKCGIVNPNVNKLREFV